MNQLSLRPTKRRSCQNLRYLEYWLIRLIRLFSPWTSLVHLKFIFSQRFLPKIETVDCCSCLLLLESSTNCRYFYWKQWPSHWPRSTLFNRVCWGLFRRNLICDIFHQFRVLLLLTLYSFCSALLHLPVAFHARLSCRKEYLLYAKVTRRPDLYLVVF